MLDSKTRKGIECCLGLDDNCINCPYDRDENGSRINAEDCKRDLYDDLMLYIEDCENVIKLLGEKDE